MKSILGFLPSKHLHHISQVFPFHILKPKPFIEVHLFDLFRAQFLGKKPVDPVFHNVSKALEHDDVTSLIK